ncbi:hypothetical protein BD770DRAFT_432899 [Pilaira anomala]|nr:hypothetical protein BD770DRAFT_432899 [Pilaira anomala]
MNQPRDPVYTSVIAFLIVKILTSEASTERSCEYIFAATTFPAPTPPAATTSLALSSDPHVFEAPFPVLRCRIIQPGTDESKNNKSIVTFSLIFYYCALWIFLVYFPGIPGAILILPYYEDMYKLSRTRYGQEAEDNLVQRDNEYNGR